MLGKQRVLLSLCSTWDCVLSRDDVKTVDLCAVLFCTHQTYITNDYRHPDFSLQVFSSSFFSSRCQNRERPKGHTHTHTLYVIHKILFIHIVQDVIKN